MVFSSVLFLFYFLPIVLLLYFLTCRSCQISNVVLLISSLVFYMCGGIHAFPLIICSIILNYLVAFILGPVEKPSIRLAIMTIGTVGNLGLLFYYKYYNFAIEIYNNMAESSGVLSPAPEKNIALPIGISFFTFQGLSYVIDVYRRKVPVQRNILKVALYISLFPQLIAGPIVRYSDIMGRLDHRDIDLKRIAEGSIRFIYGLAKKCILADVLGEVTDEVFAMPDNTLTVALAWLGAVTYTLQIYYDFSGYSDMAIGLGRIMGFDFPENFNYPYISKSVREFWRRWHISLSSWFKDYVYIPLGGSRKGNVYLNLFIVFLLTGLWHGAAFTFVIWGLWHGLFCIVERLLGNRLQFRMPTVIKTVYTLAIVMIGWVIFRSDSLSNAIGYLGAMIGRVGGDYNEVNIWYYFGNRRLIFTIILAIIGSTGLVNRILKNRSPKISGLINTMRYPYAIAIFIISLMMVVNQNYSPFIYFRF